MRFFKFWIVQLVNRFVSSTVSFDLIFNLFKNWAHSPCSQSPYFWEVTQTCRCLRPGKHLWVTEPVLFRVQAKRDTWRQKSSSVTEILPSELNFDFSVYWTHSASDYVNKMDFDLEGTEKIRIGKFYPRPLQLCRRRRSLGYSSQKRLLIFDTNIIIIANRVGRSFIYTFAVSLVQKWGI